MQYKNHT